MPSSPATTSTTAPPTSTPASTPTSPARRCGRWCCWATPPTRRGRSGRCSSTAGRTSNIMTVRSSSASWPITTSSPATLSWSAILRPLWQREIDLILGARDPSTGLLPREKYCSDIDTRIHSTNANANCWRGLRDMAPGPGRPRRARAGRAARVDRRRLPPDDPRRHRPGDRPHRRPAVRPDRPGRRGAGAGPDHGHAPGQLLEPRRPVAARLGRLPPRLPDRRRHSRYMQANGGLCMGLIRVQSVRATLGGPPEHRRPVRRPLRLAAPAARRG